MKNSNAGKWGETARVLKERFHQRRRTTTKKLDEMNSSCDVDSLWIARRNGKYYIFTTDPEDKWWAPLLREMVRIL
jgi:hypothetical protein